jgi:CelD/BcsL family acetyltransferase involved in cellulose biosynthesis
VRTVIDVDPRTDARWRDLVDRAGGSLFHSPAWSRVLADTYGFAPHATLLCDGRAGDGGAPALSGMPWCRVSDPAGSRIVSLPFSDYCGPLGSPPFGQLLDELRRPGLPVRYRVLTNANHADAATTGTVTTGVARWHGIPVTDAPEDDAWPQLSSSTRRAITKARRDRVTVVERSDIEFVDQFLRLHVGVRKRKYRLLPQPRAFFTSIRSRFGATGDWHPLAAERDGELLATTIYLRHGDTLFYKFNASDPDALEARPNDLLLWAGIELAARLGCRLVDLGASDDDQPGLIRFKRGFGASEREIRSVATGAPAADGAATFRAVLGDLTELLTEPEVPEAVTGDAGARLYRYFA